MKLKYLALFFLVLVILIITFTLGSKNDQVITFNYLIAQGQYRVSTLLATLFGVGLLFGWIICTLIWLKTRIALAQARHKIKQLEKQMNA